MKNMTTLNILSTSSPKFRQLMCLFTQTKQIGYRHTACFNVSNGRTESTRDLTENEADLLIADLKKLLPLNKVALRFTPKPGDKERKRIISIARDMQYDLNSDKEMMKLIDDFCLTRTKYKKKLMDLTEDELTKVRYVFAKQVKRSFYDALNAKPL